MAVRVERKLPVGFNPERVEPAHLGTSFYDKKRQIGQGNQFPEHTFRNDKPQPTKIATIYGSGDGRSDRDTQTD